MNNTSSLAVAFVMIAVFGFACDRTARNDATAVMTETEIALDKKTLEQLRTAGSDLSRSHTIEFYLYVPTQRDATAAASALQAKDFDTAVRIGADGKKWLCLAQKSMTPTLENLTKARQLFKSLASQYHGAYDGWEAAVQP
jgi:hypothetical protein